jgi:hypothetical protein
MAALNEIIHDRFLVDLYRDLIHEWSKNQIEQHLSMLHPEMYNIFCSGSSIWLVKKDMNANAAQSTWTWNM